MARKKGGINLHLIVRLTNPEPKQTAVHGVKLLKAVDKIGLYRDIVIHWHTPILKVFDNRENNGFITELKMRINSLGDVIIPSGFSDAYHPLLSPEELKREIDWAWQNPWKNGAADILNLTHRLMLPGNLDLLRPRALELYRSSGYSWGLISNHDSYLKILAIIGPHVPCAIPLVDLQRQRKEAGNKTALRTIAAFYNGKNLLSKQRDLAALVKKGDLFRWIPGTLAVYSEISAQTDITTLQQFLLSVEESRSTYPAINYTSLFSLGELKEQSGPPFSNSSWNQTLFNYFSKPGEINPIQRKSYASASRRRARQSPGKNITPAQYRARFNHLAFPELGDGANGGIIKGLPARELSASMTGQVTLDDNDFFALFRKGRLSGLKKQDQTVTVVKPVKSYLQPVNERGLEFAMVSVFSFQEEKSRGLREYLVLSSKQSSLVKNQGILIIDYYFTDGSPYLHVSAAVKYPGFTKKLNFSACAPLEIPLFFFHVEDTVQLQAYYTSGEHYTYPIAAENATHSFPGNRFLFTHNQNHLMIDFQRADQEGIENLDLQITKNRQGYVLSINPHGSYSHEPSPGLENHEDYFHILLGVSVGKNIFLPPKTLQQRVRANTQNRSQTRLGARS